MVWNAEAGCVGSLDRLQHQLHLSVMNQVASVLAVVFFVLKRAVFALAVLTAIAAVISWATRTRRLNPFGPLARFSRNTVDPLMRPVERRVVRAGGLPSNAPWWALVFVVVGGLVFIWLFEFVIGQVFAASSALSSGGRGLLMLLVHWTFSLLQIALLVRVISSWFQISPYSSWVRWSFVLTEWMLAPLRQIIPALGAIDITPIVAYFALRLLEGLVTSLIR
jgi:YggT family protein